MSGVMMIYWKGVTAVYFLFVVTDKVAGVAFSKGHEFYVYAKNSTQDDEQRKAAQQSIDSPVTTKHHVVEMEPPGTGMSLSKMKAPKMSVQQGGAGGGKLSSVTVC